MDIISNNGITAISHVTVSSAVQLLYIAFLGRPADPAGLAFWEGQLSSGKYSSEQLAEAFSNQPEVMFRLHKTDFVTAFDRLTGGSAVEQTFKYAFSRYPDFEGAKYWHSALMTQRSSVAEITMAITGSAQGSDRIALDAKLAAASAFTEWLASGMDTLDYAGQGGVSASEFLISRVVDATSLAQFMTEFRSNMLVQVIPETPYQLTVTGSTVAELDSGVGSAMVTVTLDKPALADLRFRFETVSDTAIAGSDFVASSGYVLFKAGQSVATLIVAIHGDLTPEAKETFSMRFFGPGLVVEASTNITIVDSDNTPAVFKSAATSYFAENSPTATLIYEAFAIDADPGDKLSYHLKPGGDSALLRMNPTTGEVTLRAPANFEAKSSYQFTVIASDSRGAAVEKDVVAHVQNVNDAPMVTGGAAKVFLSAGTVAGTAVYLSGARDEDAGAVLSYSLAGTDAALFQVNAQGVVTLRAALTGEIKPAYVFDLLVSDGAATTTKSLAMFSPAAAVQSLYVAYFGRPADAAGLAYWSDLLVNGKVSLDQIGAQFAESHEHKMEFVDAAGAALSSFHIVDKMYFTLFGRHAESAGLHFWGEALANKQVTVPQFVHALLDGAQGNDLAAFVAKASGAARFTDALSALELGYVPVYLDWSAGERFLQGSMDQAALDAAIAALGNQGPVPPAATYTLSATSQPLTEGYSVLRGLEFTLTLDRAAATDMTIAYATENISAISGVDYANASGQVFFAAGQKTATLIIQVVGDLEAELTESFLVNFSGSALKWPASATGVILDNGAGPWWEVIVSPASDPAPLDSAPYPLDDAILIGMPDPGAFF